MFDSGTHRADRLNQAEMFLRDSSMTPQNVRDLDNSIFRGHINSAQTSYSPEVVLECNANWLGNAARLAQFAKSPHGSQQVVTHTLVERNGSGANLVQC